jgi:hypothetical protein
MNYLKNNRNAILKNAWIVLSVVLLLSGIVLFEKNYNLDKLIKIQNEKMKKIGTRNVNQLLYLYNGKTPIEKYIITDYPYLGVLPGLNKYFKMSKIHDLKSSDLIFRDDSIGYILWTPFVANSREVPDFIKAKIDSGKYNEIFNYDGYRFIKIH